MPAQHAPQVPRCSRISEQHQPANLQALHQAVRNGPFAAGAPAPCQVPVHDMGSLGRYPRTLPVFEDGRVIKWAPAETSPARYRMDAALADGDRVILVEHASVDRYWYDPGTMPRGSYINHFVLAGSIGTVVKARTPWVMAPRNEDRYFANVDVAMPDGSVSRVRVAHTALKRLPPQGTPNTCH